MQELLKGGNDAVNDIHNTRNWGFDNMNRKPLLEGPDSCISISVNGQTLAIDISAFAITDDQGGTIVDSETTMAYLAYEAFTHFVNAASTIWNFCCQRFMKFSNCLLICHHQRHLNV